VAEFENHDVEVVMKYAIQVGWCDSLGSVEEVQHKMRQRQEAASKRERALSYAYSHQVCIKNKFASNL